MNKKYTAIVLGAILLLSGVATYDALKGGNLGGRIQFQNDVTRAFEEVQGSDGRLNVSSRADSRMFYVSRDNKQAYILRIEDDDAVAADLVASLRNDSKDKQLFITDIHFNSEQDATFKIAFGDSTTPTGTAVTPVNLNKGSSNDADVTALGNGAVGGVTASTFFATVRMGSSSLEEWGSQDALILGQNDSIVVEYDTGATGDVEIDIFFFLE